MGGIVAQGMQIVEERPVLRWRYTGGVQSLQLQSVPRVLSVIQLRSLGS